MQQMLDSDGPRSAVSARHGDSLDSIICVPLVCHPGRTHRNSGKLNTSDIGRKSRLRNTKHHSAVLRRTQPNSVKSDYESEGHRFESCQARP